MGRGSKIRVDEFRETANGVGGFVMPYLDMTLVDFHTVINPETLPFSQSLAPRFGTITLSCPQIG
jgi:hypothetical protein